MCAVLIGELLFINLLRLWLKPLHQPALKEILTQIRSKSAGLQLGLYRKVGEVFGTGLRTILVFVNTECTGVSVIIHLLYMYVLFQLGRI